MESPTHAEVADDMCDPQGLQESWEQLQRSGRTLDLSNITAITKMHHVTTGKWMCFPSDSSGANVDRIWELVARATTMGNLGISAKVSPYDPKNPTEYVVCIYNRDFTDNDSVFSLETGIRSVGIKCQLFYKPDCYTYLGIYRNNEWNIRPTLHESAFDLMRRASVLKTH